MRIGVLGTGGVGRELATALSEVGHQLMMGTRNPAETLAAESFNSWHSQHESIGVGDFREASDFGEVVVLATNGAAAVDVVTAVGEERLAGKIVIDVTNPLDFSAGFPPTLFVGNDDSLGERVQRAVPRARVVKTLNTVNAAVMVDPVALAEGRHTVFVSGDDPAARAQVGDWLTEWFGWRDVVDLGDMTTARGTEGLLLLWVRLMSSLGTAGFQFAVVRPTASDD